MILEIIAFLFLFIPITVAIIVLFKLMLGCVINGYWKELFVLIMLSMAVIGLILVDYMAHTKLT